MTSFAINFKWSRSAAIVLLFYILVAQLAVTTAQNATSNSHSADSSKQKKADGECQKGLMLSVWMPQVDLQIGDRIARGMVYFLCLIYLFIGVSIVSDRFYGRH